MIKVGQVCMKTAGRDAGSKCVVMSVKGDHVEVLGFRKKRKVNVKHLIPTQEKLDPKLGEAAIKKKLGVKTPAVKKDKKPKKQKGIQERIAGVLGGGKKSKPKPKKKTVKKK